MDSTSTNLDFRIVAEVFSQCNVIVNKHSALLVLPEHREQISAIVEILVRLGFSSTAENIVSDLTALAEEMGLPLPGISGEEALEEPAAGSKKEKSKKSSKKDKKDKKKDKKSKKDKKKDKCDEEDDGEDEAGGGEASNLWEVVNKNEADDLFTPPREKVRKSKSKEPSESKKDRDSVKKKVSANSSSGGIVPVPKRKDLNKKSGGHVTDIRVRVDGRQLSAQRFQMMHMGHLMTGRVVSVDDPRVGFKPDDWQVKLLDVVDDDRSAVVSAPTSSGKTFVSYYAMEHVLRRSDEGIVVYVAPTKALVRQVQADVYCRFSSKKYTKAGRTVHGIFTFDYDDNPTDCQVLITTPEGFEHLLTSSVPSHMEWASKIEYAIFDEIHCIGEGDKGAVWEHLFVDDPLPLLSHYRQPSETPTSLPAGLDVCKIVAVSCLKCTGSAGERTILLLISYSTMTATPI